MCSLPLNWQDQLGLDALLLDPARDEVEILRLLAAKAKPRPVAYATPERMALLNRLRLQHGERSIKVHRLSAADAEAQIKSWSKPAPAEPANPAQLRKAQHLLNKCGRRMTLAQLRALPLKQVSMIITEAENVLASKGI